MDIHSSNNSFPGSNQGAAPGLGLKPEDVLFIVFRHKWIVLISTVIGLLAATVLYFVIPRTYQSEAKLFLLYVLERKPSGPISANEQIQSPVSQGDSIINSELEILRSFDITEQVAEAVGPEKLVGGRAGGETSRNAAAVVIQRALAIEGSGRSSVIRLGFQHQNPNVVQPVLEKVIEFYLKKHLEIHRAGGLSDEFLTKQMEQLRFRLTKIEDDLWNLKTNSGSVSAEDFKGFSERRSKLLQELSSAEAQLEEKRAILQELQKFTPTKAEVPAANAEVPIEKVADYRNVCAQLTSSRTNLAALLNKFNEDAPFVQRTQAQLSELEKRKLKLEQEHPKLASLGIQSTAGSLQVSDLATLSSEVRVLEIRIKTLQTQLEKVKTEELAFAKAQNAILQLQRQKEVDEANYKYYASSMEQARIDETLGPGKISNIKIVEEPTPPSKIPSKRLKAMAGASAGGILFGLGLAFLIEMFLDRTIKRPGEVKSRLNSTVFSTIPYLNGNAHQYLSEGLNSRRRKLPWNRNVEALEVNGQGAANLEIAPWEPEHRLQPFFQDLRDRLINYFIANNVAHKPKLVAVTSCSRGAGVSTLAAGLAASLSETVEGNVLLVDMNSNQGSAHPFFKGKPGCALPDVFELEKRESALVHEKLYLVKGSDIAGKVVRHLPQSLADLMPKILASDYDYIIFDMPPVTAGSITPRLAPHMDMVFMVLESEKTSSEAAKNAAALLAQSKTAVAPVLNKRRYYLPAWLQMEN